MGYMCDYKRDNHCKFCYSAYRVGIGVLQYIIYMQYGGITVINNIMMIKMG